MRYFRNESEALTIGGISVENRVGRVSLYGSVDITPDDAGRRMVGLLRDILNDIEAAMADAPKPHKNTHEEYVSLTELRPEKQNNNKN